MKKKKKKKNRRSFVEHPASDQREEEASFAHSNSAVLMLCRLRTILYTASNPVPPRKSLGRFTEKKRYPVNIEGVVVVFGVVSLTTRIVFGVVSLTTRLFFPHILFR